MELEKAINELEHFSATLKNAIGLYASANELMKYCFPHRTLKEVIETLWISELEADERAKIYKSISDITQRIAGNTASAIVAFAREKNKNVHLKANQSWILYDKCNGEKLAMVLSNCLYLFHAIYDIRSIPSLFSADEVDEFERICNAATQLLDQIGSNGLKRKLPKAVLEAYGQSISPNDETNSIFAQKIYLFSTAEDTCNSKEEIDKKDNVAKFTRATEKLIDKIIAHDFDIFEMRELAEFKLTGKVDFALFRKACSVLPTVQSIVDLRVVGEFLKVLKRIAFSYNNWDIVMNYFYKGFQESDGSLKNFKEFYQDFDEDMRSLLNFLEDHSQLHTDQVRMREAVNECAWLLMISPTDTLVSLLLQCLESMLMVPNLIRILRKLPEYCKIELEAVFEQDNHSKHKAPILMLALRHILTSERASLQTDAKRRNFAYLCVALCRERRTLPKDGKNQTGTVENEETEDIEMSSAVYGEIVDFALVDGSLILNHLILPALKEVFYQEIVVEIERKLLASVGTRRTPIIWKAEQGIKLRSVDDEATTASNSGVSILQSISILLEIFNENKDYDYALAGSCQDCLRSLGERLKEDGVIIDADVFENLLACFDKSSWTYRYALASWFYDCLVSYKREVPLLLYEKLKDEEKQTMKVAKIDSDNDDTSDRCLFRHLFELGAIHPDLALNIISGGLSTSSGVAGYNISGAFVDVIRNHSRFPMNKMLGLVEVIKAFTNQMNPSRQIAPLFTEISESSFYGLRLIEPLLLIQEATICAIHYDKKDTEDIIAVPFGVLEFENETAVQLIKLFCELTKDHIEREMIDLRRSRLKYKADIKEPRLIPNNVVIDREIRVGTELMQLYIAAVLLSNHITELPPYLKILLVQLANFHIEFGRMKLGPVFDEMIGKALEDHDGKGKAKNNVILSDEQSSGIPDLDKRMATININDRPSSQTSTISNNLCETNAVYDEPQQVIPWNISESRNTENVSGNDELGLDDEMQQQITSWDVSESTNAQNVSDDALERDSEMQQQQINSWDISGSTKVRNPFASNNKPQFREFHFKRKIRYGDEKLSELRDHERRYEERHGWNRRWQKNIRGEFTLRDDRSDRKSCNGFRNRKGNEEQSTNETDFPDFETASIDKLKETFNYHRSETSRQNELFLASTRMIKDQATTTIIENRLRSNKKNSEWRGGGKPRRGALPPLEVTSDDTRGDRRRRVGERHFGGRGDERNDKRVTDCSGRRDSGNDSKRNNECGDIRDNDGAGGCDSDGSGKRDNDGDVRRGRGGGGFRRKNRKRY